MASGSAEDEATDPHWMRRAIQLAERARGDVEPNPLVGAVIVRDGLVLGEGYHTTFGGEHAEVAALRHAREKGHDPAGATVYVNLEPCSHHGKQPPCVEALIQAGVARGVVAMADPFPAVRGQGLAMLREAGIAVTTGVEQAAARWLNRGFLKRTETGVPWVIAKWAQTLDGRIATASGDSQWISGEGARQRVHAWRGQVDAVMVGPDTFGHDDPQLTARHAPVHRHARRVVVAPRGDELAGKRLLSESGPPVTLAIADDTASRRAIEDALPAAARANIELLPLPAARDVAHHLDVQTLLSHLANAHAATHVLVEGGAGLISVMLRAALIDELRVFVAPTLLGDERAIAAVRGLQPPTIDDAIELRLRDVETIESDVLLTYERPHGQPRTR